LSTEKRYEEARDIGCVGGHVAGAPPEGRAQQRRDVEQRACRDRQTGVRADVTVGEWIVNCGVDVERGCVKSEPIDDPRLQFLPERPSGYGLDHEPEDDVVRVRIEPTRARSEERWMCKCHRK